MTCFKPLFAAVLAAVPVPAAALLAAPGEPPGAGRDPLKLLWAPTEAGTWAEIRTPDQWPRRREAILAAMQEVMGPMPDDTRRVALELEIREVTRDRGVVRKKIWYTAEPGDRVGGWLFLPEGPPRRRAAVLCLHQTTTIGKDEPAGLGGLENLRYARELAERGLVTLAVDYPNFGESRVDVYELGYASATMKGIWNHRRALDLLASLEEVDPERMGVIGHSLGGHNSLFLAAFDTRVKAAVSCCGFCQFRHYMGGDLTGWSHRGYMPRIAERYGKDPARMPFDFSEVLAAIAPRSCLCVAPTHDGNFAREGVAEAVSAAGPVYELLGAAEGLQVVYPEAAHDFPPEARKAAYRWLEERLGGVADAQVSGPTRGGP